MKQFKGKTIYNPSGKAGEYSYWACNFYVGCSNRCTYCYCKKGILAGAMGQDMPQLKKHFESPDHALEIFGKEILANKEELKDHGLFFSFTTDPMLPETISLTEDAIGMAQYYGIPCKVLTKCTDWVDAVIEDDWRYNDHRKDLIAYGFTLTGRDDLEPGASSNLDRIRSMKKLHDSDFRTFASIEPIIDLDLSYDIISICLDFCDLFKVGLESGKSYDVIELQTFIERLIELPGDPKIYLKDGLVKKSRYDREDLGENFVSRDFNIFRNNM